MYQSLLTRRYLTSKIMPLLAILAVMLCSALVLTTWSIMGGFLVMLLKIGREMEGDVSISWPTVGFAHYERLIERLEADPMIDAACPVIETFGVIVLPDDRQFGVKIKGIDERFARVAAYEQSIWWKPIAEPLPKDRAREDVRLDPDWWVRRARVIAGDGRIDAAEVAQYRPWEQMLAEGLSLQEKDPMTGAVVPAVVLGIELSGFSERLPNGTYAPADIAGRRVSEGGFAIKSGFIPNGSVTLTVLPMGPSGRAVGAVSARLPVANEFRTGLYEADKNTVLIRLEELQRMLNMDEAERLADAAAPDDRYATETGPDGRERAPVRAAAGIEPARVTTVLVKGAAGTDPEAVRARCMDAYAAFSREFAGRVPSYEQMLRTIQTWERQQATFIGAVKREIAMVLFLLLFISFVAVFLILAIFWSMVSEKTKDIGVLRSIGAGRLGVAWLWLRYGVVIGLSGALLGSALAHVVVWNINPIHEWLGRALGLVIWDPSVYYFPEIPHEVIPWKAAVVLLGGVTFSVLGALIPAVKAARMDPVRALRFE
ncbi:MAG: ABC transporter permease [Phycisphaeraceae bacterium]|nr:ABC transporter permease [Phycisphaeraceae bacterium]